MSSSEAFDVVILGGGSALTTAHEAAQAGKSVAVVERGPLGGTCENRGCIPTKGLIQAAEVMHTIRSAKKFGVNVDMDHVRIDFGALMETVRQRRKQRSDGARGWVESAFTLFAEQARFVGDRTVNVGGKEIVGESVFVATGASPSIPPIPGLDSVDYLTNEGVLELKEQPQQLLVLGGGYIGAEFAHFFHQIGTKVTVVESNECLLREDEDVRKLFTKEFAKWANLHNGWRAQRVSEDGGRIRLEITRGQESKALEGDALLVATGRRPNTKELGLESTGVEVNQHGFVQVDEYLRTTHERIWATGDVNGQGMFKHTAAYEASLAWRNSQGANQKVDYRANPHAIFSNPQVGAVGLTEAEARAAGFDVKIGKVDYGGVAKGQIVGAPAGFAKAIVDKASGRILGFHMMGPNAADLVAEVVVAMTSGEGTERNILDSIHTHPTMPELVKEAFVVAA